MGIVNFPDKDIFTKQPKIYVYNNNTSASGTYYTTLNLTNTRGRLTKVSLTSSSALTNNNLTIRITIDGIVNTIGVPSLNYSVGYSHNNGTTSYQPSQSIDYFCDIVFYSSCVVEFMQNSAPSMNLEGSIMYSVE